MKKLLLRLSVCAIAGVVCGAIPVLLSALQFQWVTTSFQTHDNAILRFDVSTLAPLFTHSQLVRPDVNADWANDNVCIPGAGLWYRAQRSPDSQAIDFTAVAGGPCGDLEGFNEKSFLCTLRPGKSAPVFMLSGKEPGHFVGYRDLDSDGRIDLRIDKLGDQSNADWVLMDDTWMSVERDGESYWADHPELGRVHIALCGGNWRVGEACQ